MNKVNVESNIEVLKYHRTRLGPSIIIVAWRDSTTPTVDVIVSDGVRGQFGECKYECNGRWAATH